MSIIKIKMVHSVRLHRNICLCASQEESRVGKKHLAQTKVVLVAPKSAENVGACLRAASNFGVGRGVTLVDPRCDPMDEKISVVGVNSPLLQSMIVVPTLADALHSTSVSIAFTRRAGNARVVYPSLKHLSDRCPEVIAQFMYERKNSLVGPDLDAALVFGREESGLSDDEISQCSYAVAIPSSSDFPSLNLSHATAVVLSWLFEYGSRDCAGDETSRMYRSFERGTELASRKDIDALLDRVHSSLDNAGIRKDMLDESSGGGNTGAHGRKKLAFGHLKALLIRSRASVAEIKAMHALLRELEQSNS